MWPATSHLRPESGATAMVIWILFFFFTFYFEQGVADSVDVDADVGVCF